MTEVKLLHMILKSQDVSISEASLEKIIKAYQLIKEKGEATSLKDVVELEEKK